MRIKPNQLILIHSKTHYGFSSLCDSGFIDELVSTDRDSHCGLHVSNDVGARLKGSERIRGRPIKTACRTSNIEVHTLHRRAASESQKKLSNWLGELKVRMCLFVVPCQQIQRKQ